jgi:hypothetical protein
MQAPAALRTLIGTDGRIARLPVKLSRKEILADWLLESVEFDREYSEKQINEVFLAVVDDYALIRRMLVESGKLQRDAYGHVYRRVRLDS